MGATARPYVNAMFSLSLDAVDCGIIQKISGGNVQAEVATLAQNHTYGTLKHLTTVKYNPIEFQLGGTHAGPLNDRIKSLLAMDHQYFNGAIHALDFNLKTKAIQEFTNALLTEVTLPACDGGNKDAAYITCKIDAEKIRRLKGDDSAGGGASNAKQHKLGGANFKLVVDKVKDSCANVAKVDAYKVSTSTQRDDIGATREMMLVPAKGIEYANLSFQLATAYADEIYAWHESFVIKGNCGQEEETTAQLVYHSQNFGEELITLTLSGLGIFNITTDAVEDHKDSILRCKVECYVTKAEIAFT